MFLQVLSQVLKVVHALHEAGYAHSNVKLSNMLQRGKQHDWMLFDVSASCPFGKFHLLSQLYVAAYSVINTASAQLWIHVSVVGLQALLPL